MAAAYPVASWEVRTVTPTSPTPPAAACAAASMAAPPRVWTVAMETPRDAAAATAPATVFGMSCHLRSRKSSRPRARSSTRKGAPSRVISTDPTLTQRRSGSRSSSRRPASAESHVERQDDLSHAGAPDPG